MQTQVHATLKDRKGISDQFKQVYCHKVIPTSLIQVIVTAYES